MGSFRVKTRLIFSSVSRLCSDCRTAVELSSQPARAFGSAEVAVSVAASVCACVSPPTYSGMLRFPSFASVSAFASLLRLPTQGNTIVFSEGYVLLRGGSPLHYGGLVRSRLIPLRFTLSGLPSAVFLPTFDYVTSGCLQQAVLVRILARMSHPTGCYYAAYRAKAQVAWFPASAPDMCSCMPDSIASLPIKIPAWI